MLGWVYGSGFPKSHHALKPALEPITLARKPCKGTIASNVDVYGTGVLNIGECRIPLAEGESPYDYPNGPGGSDPNHMWRGRNKGDGDIAKQGNPDGTAALPILSMMAVPQCLPSSGITLSR
ncbi:hypothetical protein HL670_01743 [Serratia plymuthica]|nr:hypothetical protein HL670_01743 [Serratia plymuthica]